MRKRNPHWTNESHFEEGWPWGMGLFSLLDMQAYHVKRLVKVEKWIDSIFIEAEKITANAPDEEKQNARKDMTHGLKVVIGECDALSLRTTAIFARRMADKIDEVNETNSLQKADELEARFLDEIESIKFFYLDPIQVLFYEKYEKAGEQFNDRFPRANTELIEAGNCFAFDRYTSTVCHLMRAVEIVLRAFESELGIIPPDPDFRTWGMILGGIQDKRGRDEIKIAGKPSIPKSPMSPEWAKNADFFDKCLAFISAVKSAYRDKTFHVASIYDQEQSKNIFEACVVFFRHAASGLKEK